MKDYYTTSYIAKVAGVHRTTIERRINSGEFLTEAIPSKRQKGKSVTILKPDSLPVEWQMKLLEGERQIPPAPFVEGGAKSNPPQSPLGRGEDFKPGIGSSEKSSACSLSLQDQATWYQKLKPEHVAIIEKRLSIIDSIKSILDQTQEKNKARLLTAIAKEHGIHRGTYYRWRKAYDTHNLYGLRVKRFGSTRSKLNEDQKNYIKSVIRYNPDCRDTRLWEYLLDEFPEKVVSGSTVSRFVKTWKEENPDVYEYLRDPDKWKGKYFLAFGSHSEKAKHFLHYIELDSTPADVMCTDGKRYNIIGGIDIFSRKVKLYVSPSSSGMGVAALLRSIITDWGVPNEIVRDNGKDYVCNQINLILDNLQIGATTLPPFTPEGKPHIERFFRTISASLFEEADGYIGHNVADRQAIESRKTFAERLMKKGGEPVRLNMSPEDLQELMDRWLENIYNQKYHSGIKTTPENKAAQSQVPIRKVEDERALDILLLPAGIRTIGKKGIAYENGFYRSPEFAGWGGKKVQVRRDINNAGILYVFDLESNYICTAIDSAIDNMTEQEFKAAKKDQRQRIKAKINAIDVLTESPMMRRLNKSQSGKKLIGMNRTEIHSTDALSEAGNAALERVGVKPESYKTVAEQMSEKEFEENGFDMDDDPFAFMENLKIVNE